MKNQKITEIRKVINSYFHEIQQVNVGMDILKIKKIITTVDMPEQHLAYFLLVELLGFNNLGFWEKTHWTVPMKYKNKFFYLKHSKFGLSICGENETTSEQKINANNILKLLNRAIKDAYPFFDILANQAIKN